MPQSDLHGGLLPNLLSLSVHFDRHDHYNVEAAFLLRIKLIVFPNLELTVFVSDANGESSDCQVSPSD